MTKYLDDIVQYLSYNPIRLDNHLDDGTYKPLPYNKPIA